MWDELARCYELRMPARAPELLTCHDCGNAISFSATNCPHCGSRDPTGPYVHSPRELRRHRIEAPNDWTLAVAVVGFSLLGVVFGLMTASGTFAALLAGAGYGAVGLLLGVPIGFVVNIGSRRKQRVPAARFTYAGAGTGAGD